jgi:aminomethyltransferase
VLVYRWAPQHFLLVVNAGNIEKDFGWIQAHLGGVGDAVAVNASSRYALIAVQGPKAEAVLQRLTSVNLADLKYYWFAHGEFAGIRGTVSRTGYTGEDGFEVFCPPAQAERLWKALLDAGQPEGIVPAGLGARDTLRLEAAMRLCGSDMDESTTLVEAGLGWIVGWKKADFIGKSVLDAQKARGVTRKLVGFEMAERGIARAGNPILIDGVDVGKVTSGTQTPFLKKAIGLGYVPATAAQPGQALQIDIRGRRVAAIVVPLPFYKRNA